MRDDVTTCTAVTYESKVGVYLLGSSERLHISEPPRFTYNITIRSKRGESGAAIAVTETQRLVCFSWKWAVNLLRVKQANCFLDTTLRHNIVTMEHGIEVIIDGTHYVTRRDKDEDLRKYFLIDNSTMCGYLVGNIDPFVLQLRARRLQSNA